MSLKENLSQEKVQLEQTLQTFKLECNKLTSELLEKTMNCEENQKNSNKFEKISQELSSQLSIIQEKYNKSQKEISNLKKKHEENLKESDNIKEKQILQQRKTENLEQELEKTQKKAFNDEKTFKIQVLQLKEANEILKKEIGILQIKINESTENFDIVRLNRISSKKDEINHLEEKIREKSDEIAEKDIRLSKSIKQIKVLESNLNEKNEENLKLNESKKKIINENTRLKKIFKEIKEKILKIFKKKIENLKKDLKDQRIFIQKLLKTQLNDLNSLLKMKIKDLNSNFLKNQNEIDEYSLKEYLQKEYEQNLEIMKRKLLLEENEIISNLQRQISDLTNKNNEFQFHKENFNNEIRSLSMKLSLKERESQELSQKMLINQGNSDKNEENKQLLKELMTLRGDIDRLYTKHKEILDEVAIDIERLKEKQTEEIAHINHNYEEMINVMTEKLNNLERDDSGKSNHLLKMSQKISHLERINRELENKLRDSCEIPDNQIKSYESPSIKSGKIAQNTDNSQIERIYDHLEPNKSNYELFLDPSIEKSNPVSALPNKLAHSMYTQDREISSLLIDERKKDISSNNNINYSEKRNPLTSKEIDELKTLLDYSHKHMVENQEASKKFNDEANNLTEKVKEFQTMQKFIADSSFMKKYGSSNSQGGQHRGSKSDSPEFPNYSDKLTKLYSPISNRINSSREERSDLAMKLTRDKSSFI